MMAYVKVIDFLNKPTLVSPLQFAPLGLPHYPSIHPSIQSFYQRVVIRHVRRRVSLPATI